MKAAERPTVDPIRSIETFRQNRLSHVLPDFTRISWVSDKARTAWEPRVQRIGAAWSEIEWRSVLSGVRACALTSVSADELVVKSAMWAVHGLSTMPVALSSAATGYSSTSSAPRSGEPFEYRVAVGSLKDVAALKQAMDAGDDGTMGRLLGFPGCCIAFFRRTWVEDACVDTTWPMAAASSLPDDTGRVIEIDPAAPFQANILWRWMGVRAVPHLPCTFACSRTVEFGDSLLALGRELGYREEMAWLEEILGWPVVWSALHGIAEVKTPVLKASARTDATRDEFVVRRPGTGRMPPEAATGLAFPFRAPSLVGLTHSLSFLRGLDAPIARQAELPDWYASDNGFSTRAAMDDAHRPIVELAAATLPHGGLVLDLGCGNGALLKKIGAATANVIPIGFDTDANKLEHARLLQPAFKNHFVAGNMFDGIPLDADTIYSLILLMPGRFAEVGDLEAARLRDWLHGHFEHLLVYAYGEWLTRYDGLEGLAARAGLRLVSQHAGGTAGLATIPD